MQNQGENFFKNIRRLSSVITKFGRKPSDKCPIQALCKLFIKTNNPQALKLANQDGDKINELKRISGSANVVHKSMLERPIAPPNWIKEKTGLSHATVNTCLREFEKIGIVKEMTGQKRNRLYSYSQYIDIMNKGTELSMS